jgi:hypothetical protein
MTEYRICVHEAAHAVAAAVFDVPFICVSVKRRQDRDLGRLTPDPAWARVLVDDPLDGKWPAWAYAMTSLAGPLGEAAWCGEKLDWSEHLDFTDYGNEQDFRTAELFAEETGTEFVSLLKDTADFLEHDKIWLAVQRVADALVDKELLLEPHVRQLVGLEAR